MPKLLASSQITITDLNDSISLRSHIGSSHARVQLLNNNNTYIPNYSSSNLVLTAEMNRVGNNTDLVANPGVLVSRIAWYVKLAPSQTYTQITPSMTQYELSGVAPFYKGLKVKSNIMTAATPGVTFKVEIDYKEPWMPEAHTQISEIDFSLSIQGTSGADSYTPILTNSAHTVICQSNSTPMDGELGASGRATCDTLLYKGTKTLTSVSSSPGTGQYSISVTSDDCEVIKEGNDGFYINSFKTTVSSFKIAVLFNVEGSSTVRQEMTISKVFNGVNGANGVAGTPGEPAKYTRIVSLEGGTVFKQNNNKEYENQLIVLQANTFNISSPTYKWYGLVNNSWQLISGQTSKTLNVPVDHSFFDTAASITFRCLVSNVYHDEITLSRLTDGEDSITVHLTNDSHVVNCFYDGTLKPNELDLIYTDIEVYKGALVLPVLSSENSSDPNYYTIIIEKDSTVTTSLVGNQLKVTALNTDSASITIKIVFADKTLSKTMSIVKANDGKEGLDGHIASLSNEYHALPANSSGTVSSYSGCSTKIELRKGMSLLSSGVTYSASPGTGVTGSLSGNTYTVTGVTSDISTVNLTATYSGVQYTKVFTIAKNKQGATGNQSESYWLIPDESAIHLDQDGNPSIDKIVFTAKVKKGTSAVTDYADGSFEVFASISGGAYVSVYKSAAKQSSYTYTLPDNISGVRCYLRKFGEDTILDIKTTHATKDGADAAYLQIQGASVIMCDQNGAYTPSSGITLTASTKNVTGTVVWKHNTTVLGSGTTYTVPASIFNSTGVYNIRAEIQENTSVYDLHAISKVTDGVDSLMAYVWAPNGTTIRNNSVSSLVVEAVMFNGSSNISTTSSASYHWQKKVGASWVDIKGTSTSFITGSSGGNTVTITQDDIPQTLVVRCNMKFKTQVQTDTIVLEDINDPVNSNIFSTNGTVFKNGEGETYLVAKTIRNGIAMDVVNLVDRVPTTAGVQGEIVFVKNRTDDSYYKYNNSAWGKIDIPSYGDNSTYSYAWTKTDRNGDIVEGWSREGKVIFITNSEVDGIGDFMVDITG